MCLFKYLLQSWCVSWNVYWSPTVFIEMSIAVLMCLLKCLLQSWCVCWNVYCSPDVSVEMSIEFLICLIKSLLKFWWVYWNVSLFFAVFMCPLKSIMHSLFVCWLHCWWVNWVHTLMSFGIVLCYHGNLGCTWWPVEPVKLALSRLVQPAVACLQFSNLVLKYFFSELINK